MSLTNPSVSLLGSIRLDGKAWFILGEKALEVALGSANGSLGRPWEAEI